MPYTRKSRTSVWIWIWSSWACLLSSFMIPPPLPFFSLFSIFNLHLLPPSLLYSPYLFLKSYICLWMIQPLFLFLWDLKFLSILFCVCVLGVGEGIQRRKHWYNLGFRRSGCVSIQPSLPALSIKDSVQFSSVVQLCPTLWTHELQHARPCCPWPTPGVYSNSCPSSRWCHPAISSSVVPFSSCPQSLPASGSFPMSQLFTSGGQSIGVSASASVLPMNTQDWSFGWTGWISLQSKGLSRVFSNTTIQKHQFYSTQLSSQSKSHIRTWPLEKP